MDFDFSELNPIALGLGLFGGLISVVVMSNSNVGLLFKIGGFIATTAACYFIVAKMANN